MTPCRSIILSDTEYEFGGVNGNLLRPVCGVFKDFITGQEWRLWRGEFGPEPPFSTGPDTLFVAYYASAEIGFFRALNWPIPARILDLFVEFRNRTNGLSVGGNGLINALEYFGLDTIGAVYKQNMIDLVLRGPPWTEEERQATLDYCAGDVYAIERLLPVMLPGIDLPRALLRGRYMGNIAAVETNGVPIDVPKFNLARRHWKDIQNDLITEINVDYGVYEGRHFREHLFEAFLERHNIPWPRLESGRLDLDDSKRHVFREMAKIYPIISPLRELRNALSTMRLFEDMAIGEDGRNRTLLSPFGTITGRNQPSNAKFIFGTATWIRGFIKPPPGHAIAYIDWSSQEVGIGASISGDKNMKDDFDTGDPYIAFGVRAGLLPDGATKASAEESHPGVRDMIKACVLGMQYGMGYQTLAFRIGRSTITARELIRAHQDRYPKFWSMADSVVACAMQGQPINTYSVGILGPVPMQVETGVRY
jgi:DNA polymerase I